MDIYEPRIKEALFEAFNQLLTEKDYSKITVQDIIAKANIGKNTFYSYFQTKHNLLKEMCDDWFEQIFSDITIPETANLCDFSWSEKKGLNLPVSDILLRLQYSKENMIGILTGENGELFLSRFKDYLSNLITDQIFNGIERKNVTIPDDFLMNHITVSFIGMVQWWIRSGLEQTPEELEQYFQSVIYPVI